MQWKPANKHVEKYWCLFIKEVCREPPLTAPLPCRNWQEEPLAAPGDQTGPQWEHHQQLLRGLK